MRPDRTGQRAEFWKVGNRKRWRLMVIWWCLMVIWWCLMVINCVKSHFKHHYFMTLCFMVIWWCFMVFISWDCDEISDGIYDGFKGMNHGGEKWWDFFFFNGFSSDGLGWNELFIKVDFYQLNMKIEWENSYISIVISCYIMLYPYKPYSYFLVIF